MKRYACRVYYAQRRVVAELEGRVLRAGRRDAIPSFRVRDRESRVGNRGRAAAFNQVN